MEGSSLSSSSGIEQAPTVIAPKTHLVGHKQFVRHNPMTDRFEVKRFHHLEFYAGDATNAARRFGWGLGMAQVAKSDHSTGNHTYASYVMRSKQLTFVFTAPYAPSTIAAANNNDSDDGSSVPHPGFDAAHARGFFDAHGLAVKAIGIEVADAAAAFAQCTAHGGKGTLPPTTLKFPSNDGNHKSVVMSEVLAYPGGDVVLRFLSGDLEAGPFLPGYEPTPGPEISYGLERVDHVVGNVHELLPAVNYLMGMTGWHEFAEFVAEDVGTIDSGLNSMVLASNTEAVLLPVNEPTFGTKRKSQIQTYLEQNGGPGVQHIALKTDDIFTTMAELKQRAYVGGFDFMPRASEDYYKNLPAKLGEGALTPEQYRRIEELGLLADKDDQGVLLQIFTRPVGDRPTLFLEIIQRVCPVGDAAAVAAAERRVLQDKPGCGGFGKGNFSELFKSIERFEAQLFNDA